MQVVNKKIKIVIMSMLVILGSISSYMAYKSYTNKEVVLPEVELKEEQEEMFAILIEQEDGSYLEESSFPSDGYKYNEEKSGCIDINGERIEGILSYDNSTNKAVVETEKTSYCYLYFDIHIPNAGEKILASSPSNLNTSLEGGLYRYQGTDSNVTNNYICFGTSSTSDCTENTDLYMYRIIGINENNQLKLIKKEVLNSKYAWQEDTNKKIWPETDLYNYLNGIEGGEYSDLFVNGDDYPYMADTSEWYAKIADTNWKYGDTTINDVSAQEMYDIENAWTDTVSAKIGLMYIHDYYYGMPGGNNCSNSGAYETCETSWIYSAEQEWLVSRYPNVLGGNNPAWYVKSGGVATLSQTIGLYVRPVFYLISDITIDGFGTSDNPYIIV